MPFTMEEVNYVYDKTDGYCYYCGKKLSFVNYGKLGNHGSWEIDHSKPVSKGGSDYLRNLVPACTTCNRDKSNRHGTHYKRNFKYKTVGGQLADMLGLPEGFLGSSRRKEFR
ncbi:MAG: HNH endonuclease [Nitrosopumilaceae archaeon]